MGYKGLYVSITALHGGFRFYLNLVGYKVVIYRHGKMKPLMFYLNLVGYKVEGKTYFSEEFPNVLSELSGI